MKKIGKILLVITLVCIVAAAGFAANKDTVVYITKSGGKYHTGSCSYLSKSKIETTLGEAVGKGYGPCSRCKPPILDK
jgi:competence protein ComEC